MKILIIATNDTPAKLRQAVAAGQHPRIDYMELASRLQTTYIDYNRVGSSRPMAWIERSFRMDFRLARQVNQIVECEGYDCVLSLSERVGLPLARTLNPRVRHVVIMHHPMSSMKLRMMQLMDAKRRWDKIIAISHAEAEGLKEMLDLPDNKVTALLTPVDTDFYDPAHVSFPLEEQDHIQSLGLSHRDYPTLIRAMRKLPDIPCYLRVGSTWVDHKAGHENEVLPPNIHLKPYIQPLELRESYARSRFIVVPIKDDTQWSAGCTSVQIGAAMGKAVIASDRPGLANYVIDGETGILVRTGDEQDMAEAIEYLWRNPEKAAQMGEQGRARQVALHSMDRWLEDIVQIIHGAAVLALLAVISISKLLDKFSAITEHVAVI
jgi:glycosyltransferase involved in cell wall biosynthesis